MTLQEIQRTTAPAWTILIRLAVGAVFLSEGIQKFINPSEVGAGRFQKIGFPNPELVAAFVGTFEIVCGSLVLVGFFTRLAVIPLLIIMQTAIATTQLPILMAKGFWTMAHDSRTDYSMLLGSLFLLIVGAGRWSLDGRSTTR